MEAKQRGALAASHLLLLCECLFVDECDTMPKKKGWLKASFAVRRRSGSYSKRCCTRLKKSSWLSVSPRLYFYEKQKKNGFVFCTLLAGMTTWNSYQNSLSKHQLLNHKRTYKGFSTTKKLNVNSTNQQINREVNFMWHYLECLAVVSDVSSSWTPFIPV